MTSFHDIHDRLDIVAGYNKQGLKGHGQSAPLRACKVQLPNHQFQLSAKQQLAHICQVLLHWSSLSLHREYSSAGDTPENVLDALGEASLFVEFAGFLVALHEFVGEVER